MRVLRWDGLSYNPIEAMYSGYRYLSADTPNIDKTCPPDWRKRVIKDLADSLKNYTDDWVQSRYKVIVKNGKKYVHDLW